MEARKKWGRSFIEQTFYFLPSTCQGLSVSVFSGWVLLVDKFRILIISGTRTTLTSDLLSQALPRGGGIRMGWGGRQRRGPPRRAQHLLCSAGSVCQAVGGKRAWSHQPTLRRNSPEPPPRTPPDSGLLPVSLGRWGAKATCGNLKERGVGRSGTTWNREPSRSRFRPPMLGSSAVVGRAGCGAQAGSRAAAARQSGRGRARPPRRSSPSGLAGAPARPIR